MNKNIKNSLLRTIQKEYIRRILIKYFTDKGYSNFDISPYPPNIIDINSNVDILNGFIEMKYFLEDINIQNNTVKMGWNMFVGGNCRIFCGYTIHKKLSDIDQESAFLKDHDGPTSIKSIINTIVDNLQDSTQLNDIYKNRDVNDGYTPSSRNVTMARINRPIHDFRNKV
jgi:hypothetical protein